MRLLDDKSHFPNPEDDYTLFYYIAKHCTRNKYFIGSEAFEINNKRPAQVTHTSTMHNVHSHTKFLAELFGKQLQCVRQIYKNMKI